MNHASCPFALMLQKLFKAYLIITSNNFDNIEIIRRNYIKIPSEMRKPAFPADGAFQIAGIEERRGEGDEDPSGGMDQACNVRSTCGARCHGSGAE